MNQAMGGPAIFGTKRTPNDMLPSKEEVHVKRVTALAKFDHRP